MLRDNNGMMLAFGPFTVDVVRRTVMKNGVPLRLTLRCIELLMAFVRNPGKTLTKQELLELAWPDPQASDATLAQHVFLLRRALRHETYEWIRTVPNVGYCFDADVRPVDAGDDERARAWRSYVEGAARLREIGSERALRSAIDLCSHAIALDDGRASTFALRAGCWRLLAELMHAEPLACLQSAQADVDAALSLDPADPAVRLEAAYCAAMLDRDGLRAQRHLDAVERIKPGDPESIRARVMCALVTGSRDEALRHARVIGGELYGSALFIARDFARALEVFDRFAGRDVSSRMMRGACRALTGDLDGAASDLQSVYYTDAAEDGSVFGVRQYALGFFIYTLAKRGERERARRALKRLESLSRERYISPMVLAMAHLGLGDADAAIACVEDALRRRDPWAAYVHVDPMLDELRAHPKFSDVANAA
jgi:DNA-binding winged helix-turn-helix (wHTH) protein